MKKILACLIVALMLVMALASCDIGGSTSATTTEPAPTTPAVDPLENAKAFLYAMYKDEATTTNADIIRLNTIASEGVQYRVEWSVAVNQGEATDVVIEDGVQSYEVVINVNEKTNVEVKYVLTATIYDAEGNSVSVSFPEYTVPAYAVMSWAEYVAAAKDDPVVVQGVITAIFCKSQGASYNGMYLQDADGGYYVYSMANDVDPAAAGFKVGMTVQASGIKDIYSGTHEVKDAVVETIKEELTEVVIYDYTEIFANASALNVEALAGKQAQLVTIKGVVIVPQDSTVSSGYYKFKMGDLETYVRVSSSVCPIPTAEQAAFKAAHGEHAGWTANVTGVISVYNGNFYLTPVDANAFEYISAPECDHIAADAWTTDGSNHWKLCTICGLQVGAQVAHSPVGSACATCGYTPRTLTLPEAIEIAAAGAHNVYTSDKYIIVVTVSAISNSTYGNMTVVDANGVEFTIYGSYSADGVKRFDAMDSKPAEGDTVVFFGALGNYNGTPQMKNAWILSWETPAGGCQHTPSADWTYNASKHWHVCALCGENKTDETYHDYANGSSCADCGFAAVAATLPEAIEIAAAQEHNVYTNVSYIVSGKIVSIDPDKNDATKENAYGNMTIEDASGNQLYIYGLYTANGKTRFDKMDPKPAVGDTITVIGILGQYNGKVQMKNGSMVAHSVPAPHTHEAGAEWLKDADNHWNVCECGEIMNKAAHDFSNGDCACGQSAPVCEHASDAWLSDDNNHWKVCGVCGEIFATAAHEFVDGADCVCGKEAPHVHAPEADYSYDDDNHWQECACGEEMNKAAHDFSNGDCVCGKEAPALQYTSIADALSIGAAGEHNVYTSEKYILRGVITEVQNTTYGNVVISDGVKTILIYGLYSADGSTRYDAMSNKPVVGDLIVVSGGLGNYYGSPQMKNGWLVEVDAEACAEHSYVEIVTTAATCTVTGSKISTCCVCGVSSVNEIPAGHNPAAAWTYDAENHWNLCTNGCGEPQNVAAHTMENGECTVCGKAADAVVPEIETIKADFSGFSKNTNYSTSTKGLWTATNCAVMVGGSTDSNPVFKCIGSSDSVKALTLNGKSTAKGKLQSATLTGGISVLRFNYGHMFSESKGPNLTITITGADGTVLTKTLAPGTISQKTAYEFEWILEEAISGSFTITIVNNGPSNSTSNKDRVSIWNLEWDNFPSN